LGRRSRKAGSRPVDEPGSLARRLPPSAEETRADPLRQASASRSARTEARNAEIRERLQELEPDEHPLPLKFAIGTCFVLAASNLGLAASGYEIKSDDGGSSSYVGVVLFSLILLVAAGGMFRHRYWAVLGFQALLALTVLIAGLSVVVASNIWAAVLCLAVIGYGGWLFWAMIRVMARIQMPQARRPRV